MLNISIKFHQNPLDSVGVGTYKKCGQMDGQKDRQVISTYPKTLFVGGYNKTGIITSVYNVCTQNVAKTHKWLI